MPLPAALSDVMPPGSDRHFMSLPAKKPLSYTAAPDRPLPFDGGRSGFFDAGKQEEWEGPAPPIRCYTIPWQKADLAFRAEIAPDKAAFAAHDGEMWSRKPTPYGTSSAGRTVRFLLWHSIPCFSASSAKCAQLFFRYSSQRPFRSSSRSTVMPGRRQQGTTCRASPPVATTVQG